MEITREDIIPGAVFISEYSRRKIHAVGIYVVHYTASHTGEYMHKISIEEFLMDRDKYTWEIQE